MRSSGIPEAMAAATHRWKPLLLLSITALLLLNLVPVGAQEEPFPTGPGLDWHHPDSHGMFLNGTAAEPGLDRTLPSVTGQPPGEITFLASPFRQQLVDVESLPATEAALINGSLEVRLFAGLDAASIACSGSNLGGSAETTFHAIVEIGDTVVLDESSEDLALQNDWNDAHEFTMSTTVDTMLDVGETIRMSVEVTHRCQLRDGRFFWGTYDLPSGLSIGAEMLQPSLNVSVDSHGATRIEFTPHSPFGEGDYQNIKIDVIGPLDTWEQGVHYPILPGEEIHVEHLELPAHGTRQTESGRFAWTWVTNATLDEGMYVIDLCAVTSDGLYTEPCHLIGVLRFEVSAAPQAMFGSGWYALIPVLSTVGLLGFFLQTRLPPWPVLVVIILMMVGSMGAATTLPDLGSGEQQVESAAPDFGLLTHGGGQETLGDLSDGRPLVLGVFTAGSPSAGLQMRDFLEAQDKLGDRASYAQLITGERVEMYDGDPHAAVLNGSWPLLIDESDGGVAMQLPTGIADGVVIIDAAGFVVAWHPTTMNPIDIEKWVETAEGDRQPLEILAPGMLLVLFPLLLLGLPVERIEAPETVLIPGAGWLGTAGAAALGYALWALPVAIVGTVGASLWTWAQVALIGWCLWQAVALLIWQRIPEVDLVASLVHSRLPSDYREWRLQEMFVWDARMGMWFAWLSWVAMPTLLAQGVGGRIAGGGWGLLTGPLMLVAFILAAGLIVLLFRIVAAIGGPISRLGGVLARPVMPRAWGALSAGLCLWLLLWFGFGPLLG